MVRGWWRKSASSQLVKGLIRKGVDDLEKRMLLIKKRRRNRGRRTRV